LPNLAELKNIPNWQELYPEAYRYMKAICAVFREPHKSLQIVLPSPLTDIIAAKEGDRKAALRLGQLFPSFRKVDPDLLTDAVLIVLAASNGIIPIYNYDGSRSTFSGVSNPDDWWMEKVWDWLQVEVAEAIRCSKRREPYDPKLREPLVLPLLKTGGGGRKKGSGMIYTEEEFRESYHAAIKKLREHERRKPTNKEIADAMTIREGLLYDYKAKYLR
jgi:hypothetical protein